MTEQLAQIFDSLGPELLTLALACLPISELRGAIPWAVFVLDMSWQKALTFGIIGNLIPVPFILLLLEPAEKWLSKWKIFRLFFDWLFARTRQRGKIVERFKAIGLTLFVAIPLPVTGAWTGALAARIFGVRFIPAIACVTLGVCIAGVIVTLACQGLIGFWDISRKFAALP